MFSQNNEEQYILEYFKGQESQINFLEIGAYSPFTFSNTRALVELGHKGVYVEPSPKCFAEFAKEYGSYWYMLPTHTYIVYGGLNKYPFFSNDGTCYQSMDSAIFMINAALGIEDKKVIFYDSKGDAISSTSIEHKEKWEAGYNVKYDEIEVQMISINTLFNEIKRLGFDGIDFLNLDVESTNIELFNLIPDWFWERLKMICIEHDGQMDYIISKLQPFSFSELHRNGENLIMAK